MKRLKSWLTEQVYRVKNERKEQKFNFVFFLIQSAGNPYFKQFIKRTIWLDLSIYKKNGCSLSIGRMDLLVLWLLTFII